MGRKGSSAGSKAKRDVYRDNAIKNRIRRIQKHLKKHPDDEQAQAALKNPTVRSGRRPNKRGKSRMYVTEYTEGFKRKKTYTRYIRVPKFIPHLDKLARKADRAFMRGLLVAANRRDELFYKTFNIPYRGSEE